MNSSSSSLSPLLSSIRVDIKSTTSHPLLSVKPPHSPEISGSSFPSPNFSSSGSGSSHPASSPNSSSSSATNLNKKDHVKSFASVELDFAYPFVYSRSTNSLKDFDLTPLHFRILEKPQTPLNTDERDFYEQHLNSVSGCGLTPLMYACGIPSTPIETIKMLVEWGAHTKVRWLGCTASAFNFAVCSLHVAAVRYFVECLGFDPRFDGSFQWNPCYFSLVAHVGAKFETTLTSIPVIRVPQHIKSTVLETLTRYWNIRLFHPLKKNPVDAQSISQLENTDTLSRMIEMLQYLINCCQLDPNELSPSIEWVRAANPQGQGPPVASSYALQYKTALFNFVHPRITRFLTSRALITCDVMQISIPRRFNALESMIWENKFLFSLPIYRSTCLHLWFAEQIDDLMGLGCRIHSLELRKMISKRQLNFIVSDKLTKTGEVLIFDLNLSSQGNLMDPLFDFAVQDEHGKVPEPCTPHEISGNIVNVYSGFFSFHELESKCPEIANLKIDLSLNYLACGAETAVFRIPGTQLVLKTTARVLKDRGLLHSTFVARHPLLQSAMAESQNSVEREIFRAQVSNLVHLQSLKHVISVVQYKHVAFEPLGITMIEPNMKLSLFQYIKARRNPNVKTVDAIPFKTKKVIAQQLIRTVAEIHKKGILHADVSENNIYLSPKGNPMTEIMVHIGDFGLSVPLDENGKALIPPISSAAITVWTARPPEGMFASPHVTREWDIWSLGTVLWSLFYEEILFSSQAKEEKNLLAAMVDIFSVPSNSWIVKHIQKPSSLSRDEEDDDVEEDRERVIPEHPMNKRIQSARKTLLAKINEMRETHNPISSLKALNQLHHRVETARRSEEQCQIPLDQLIPEEEVPDLLSLLSLCLQWDPRHRRSADYLLGCPFFAMSSQATSMEVLSSSYRDLEMQSENDYRTVQMDLLAKKIKMAPSVERALKQQCPHLIASEFKRVKHLALMIFSAYLLKVNDYKSEMVHLLDSLECKKYSFDPVELLLEQERSEQMNATEDSKFALPQALITRLSAESFDGEEKCFSYWMLQIASTFIACSILGIGELYPWSFALLSDLKQISQNGALYRRSLNELTREKFISCYVWKIGCVLSWDIRFIAQSVPHYVRKQ